jgi:hypothetical protein
MHESLRLPQYRFGPGQAQPAKIGFDGDLKLRPRPRGIQILDAQQTAAAARRAFGGQGCVGVTQVQPSGRARGESRRVHRERLAILSPRLMR